MPAIAALTTEHDDIRAVARNAARAARDRNRAAAAEAARQLLALLGPHTEIEERALFPAMAGEHAEHVASLESDHRRIEDALVGIVADDGDADWGERLGRALAELFTHILREQDGLFPAALAVLTPEHWDALDAVRAEVTSRKRGAVIPA